MDETKKRVWDVRLGIVGPALTVAGLLLGVWQFNAGQEDRRKLELESAIKKDDLEFRRRLWLERLTTYRAVAETAGKIVAAENEVERKKFVREFTAAYWGAMILVEDRSVEKAMVEFYVETQDYESGWGSLDRLKRRASTLISACRLSAENGAPR
jgi:hypothetical protein